MNAIIENSENSSLTIYSGAAHKKNNLKSVNLGKTTPTPSAEIQKSGRNSGSACKPEEPSPEPTHPRDFHDSNDSKTNQAAD